MTNIETIGKIIITRVLRQHAALDVEIDELKKKYESQTDILIDTSDDTHFYTLNDRESMLSFLQSEFDDVNDDNLPSEYGWGNVRITSDGIKYVVDLYQCKAFNDKNEVILTDILRGNFAPFMAKPKQSLANDFLVAVIQGNDPGQALEDIINDYPSYEQLYQVNKIKEELDSLFYEVKSIIQNGISENFESIDDAKSRIREHINQSVDKNYENYLMG